jgi:membrane-associated protease RseP (regulator of RpoE activity)
MIGMGFSKTGENNGLLSFKGDADNVVAFFGNKSTGKEFKITFSCIQSNNNVRISTDVKNVLWDSYLDELKARINGRWTFGVVTEPRKDHFYEVSSIILNSSAAKEGLKKGDRIIKINGSSVYDFDQDLNPYFIKAPEKSILTLEIETGDRR